MALSVLMAALLLAVLGLKRARRGLGFAVGMGMDPRNSQGQMLPLRPCYRCRTPAEVFHAGYFYCEMCRDVIVATIGSVGHDPPFGFPGQKGYVEFPKDRENPSVPTKIPFKGKPF